MSSFVFFTVKASGCKKLHSCYAGCYASHSFTLLTNSTNLYPSLLVCFLYHSTLLMRHKLLIQNFYLLAWHQITPPHGCICVCNKYYIKYAFFSCSYLEGNMLTSVPKELANLKQLSLVYVPLT